jgi:hypothetical protein
LWHVHCVEDEETIPRSYALMIQTLLYTWKELVRNLVYMTPYIIRAFRYHHEYSQTPPQIPTPTMPNKTNALLQLNSQNQNPNHLLSLNAFPLCSLGSLDGACP